MAEVSPLIDEQWEGKVEVADETALVQRNHWWLGVMSEGDATQVPSETVRACPLALVPETSGFVVATGALVMIAVEAVNWVEVPTELVATTRARMNLPMSEVSTKLRVVAVEDAICVQLLFKVLAAAKTWLVQTNHW